MFIGLAVLRRHFLTFASLTGSILQTGPTSARPGPLSMPARGPGDVYDGDWLGDVLEIGPENYYSALEMEPRDQVFNPKGGDDE